MRPWTPAVRARCGVTVAVIGLARRSSRVKWSAAYSGVLSKSASVWQFAGAVIGVAYTRRPQYRSDNLVPTQQRGLLSFVK